MRLSPSSGHVDRFAALPVIDQLKEQVIRDSLVLREDVSAHIPNTQFFVDRIASYRETIAALEASHDG